MARKTAVVISDGYYGRTIEKIDVALENSMTVIDSGFITESLKKHITELEEEKLQVEKCIVQEKIKAPKLDRKQVIFFLRKFRNGDINDIGRIFFIGFVLILVFGTF